MTRIETTSLNVHALNGGTKAIKRLDVGFPAEQGLYNPANEKDSCGVGFIANMKGVKSHQIVKDALTILVNLEHRGAVGADPRSGDGAGILVQIPHKFFLKVAKKQGVNLPASGEYAAGYVFMPRTEDGVAKIKAIYEKAIEDAGFSLLMWREVPTDNASLGVTVIPTEPFHYQVFIGKKTNLSEDDFERELFLLRKVISNAVYNQPDEALKGYYPVSLSCRTIVYKGMFLADQLGKYYTDLTDKDFESALGLIHQRFSTNTFPTWSLAHPYRMVAHNGEINTLRGNVNWMAARQASVHSKLYGDKIQSLFPISYEGQSDTACLDNALEFLVRGGYSLPHAMMMLVPEAWSGNAQMDDTRKSFYEYHAAIMEPWDGPADIAFTDGKQIGAVLDRNGLRPSRWFTTKDDRIIMASEMGVLPVPESEITKKWRLQPGKMLLVDLAKGRIISDEEIKLELAKEKPYQQWLDECQIVLEDLPPVEARASRTDVTLLDRQQAFGYTQEDTKILMSPMAITGQEAVGSMGTDTPISVLSRKSKLLYTYFKQNFAQVTNPPIDPIREELVMSLVSFVGPRPNLFDLEQEASKKRLEVRQPILTNEDLEKIRCIGHREDGFDTKTLDITYAASKGAAGMEAAVKLLCQRAETAVVEKYNIIILSDRQVGSDRIAIPALLATAAVHHHLIRKGLRTSVGLVVETGEAREIHHFCCLAGYGAEAINPWLAFDTMQDLHAKGMFPKEVSSDESVKRFIKSIGKGILKVMSKMGISTYQSYCGAQIFDAVGLSTPFVQEYFTGTATQIEGIGLIEVANETVLRHHEAFSDIAVLRNSLEVGGEYMYRLRGEDHAWEPETVANLQHAVRGNAKDKYQTYAKIVNENAEKFDTIRGLFVLKPFGKAVSLEAVEPASEIVKRFVTGAMSFGSISAEAHETLAIAMNQMGGKSNTGEGGEEAERFTPMRDGRSRRSSIKQVASGRFGVTTEYLVNSDMMQIKVAQGAKPGEGGQLPGHKVDARIAKVRHSTPGVGLISPPPHHDIYSIEDLAQLIFDLKNVNPAADVSVKLVAEVGVGTVAAGVAKARADHITISGFEGGTGASPLTSLKHAGSPWEIGLAETQQTLVLNNLRSRVRLQVDGGLKTGRDVVIGALLGADEFGFSTAPLIAAGCIMMRKCHLNTCPVGIATQDPVLRKRFKGTAEHVINYFFFVAEEVREIMASLGVTNLNDLIGRSDLLDQTKATHHWKAHGLDFSKLFHKPLSSDNSSIYHTEIQHHPLEGALDYALIKQASKAIETAGSVTINEKINSVNRSVGAMISGVIAKKYGYEGLEPDSIKINLKGTAGQSFGAFLANGVTLSLEGVANDYVGKGLSGGKIIVKPASDAITIAEESIIVGNTVLYGAVSGEAYFRGIAGERFAVRNSGAIAVVEGTGDHGCEYMTGGLVVVIGETGRNFAAGMSGGVAYVLDEKGDFAKRCNLSMVDLEPVPEEEELSERLLHSSGDLETKGKIDIQTMMNKADEERLVKLIQNHLAYTGSTRASDILNNWADYRGKFVKVMPLEYKRALREMEQAKLMAAE